MNVTEALDREVIVERAEAVRFWLLGFSLSNRATGAIQRELGAIIADDSGANGQRPLAGLTVADFVSELHSLNGGAIGRVKSVGDAVLKELRAAIPADRAAAPELEAAAPVEAADEAPWAEYEFPHGEVQPAPRRPGRPEGSITAAQNGGLPPQEPPAPAHEEAPAVSVVAPEVEAPQAAEPQTAAPEAVAPKRRGRPRRAVAPDPSEAATPKRGPGRPRRAEAPSSSLTSGAKPTTNTAAPVSVAPPSVAALAALKAAPNEADPVFDQLIQLWSSLHPHARRAVVLYASDLLVEAT